MEIPYTGCAIIDEGFDGIKITIPAKKNWAVILFFGAWLGGWFIGESSALREVFINKSASGGDFFMVFWLCGWTIGGFFALRVLLWMLIGKEIISISMGALTIDKQGALFYRAKSFDLHEANNFRAEDERVSSDFFGNTRMNNFISMKNTGTIRFDYGMQTIRFADGVDEAEANFILKKLRDKKVIS